jgi:hypothetical protein
VLDVIVVVAMLALTALAFGYVAACRALER